MTKFEHVKDLLETAQKIEIGAAERYREYAEIADYRDFSIVLVERYINMVFVFVISLS